MNYLALFDAILAATALWMAVRAFTRPQPVWALFWAGLIMGIAASLGALRFSGLWPAPQAHQLFSSLGAAVTLPLCAWACLAPTHRTVRSDRPALLLVLALGALDLIVLYALASSLWSSACALLSVLGLLVAAWRRRNAVLLLAALCVLGGLLSFVLQWAWPPLQAADFLHIGLALGLVLISLVALAPDRARR